jgi:hypothetical protein
MQDVSYEEQKAVEEFIKQRNPNITGCVQAQVEMPKYLCHKQVWALKIKSIDFDAIHKVTKLTPEESGYAPVVVDQKWMEKHQPVVGGYYVGYDDGYKSFSPAKAFEDGYTRIP